MESVQSAVTKKSGTGISVVRRFTQKGKPAIDAVKYEKRNSQIVEPDGSVVFEMKDLDIPSSWSQLATDIVVSKYFRKAGVPGTGHEVSVKQVVFRIANSIRSFGEHRGYFSSKEDADSFEEELSYLLVNQHGAFNSPVWFNCGLYHQYGISRQGGGWYWDFEKQSIFQTLDSYSHPQCSACFIQSVEDDLMRIFELAKNEAFLFKFGSGTGSNFSAIRSKYEKLSSGGTSSGLMAFLEVLDRAAGSMKSGGTTRRAAKMVCLDMDHPEILDLVNWKMKEERKVKVLIDAGFPSDFNGEAYHTVSGQNANNSVRLPDEFMNAVLNGGTWATRFRTTSEIHKVYDARFMMDEICKAAWACADPGVQFDTIINDWHTCPNSDRIKASNPCSEYMFLDDSACNLASINLIKYADAEGNFDVSAFRHACRVFFIAQEILVDFASYPTESIARNSHMFRPLGLGFANLGTLLMVNGLPYDSDMARSWAGAITAIMTGHAYCVSAEMAASLGPFEGYVKNKEPMLNVMNKHRDAAYKLDIRLCPKELIYAAREDWDEAVKLGERFGYRNAQSTLLAPTGTVGLLMDCDTTGVEPDFSLVKFKKLAGGGYFKIVNQSVARALKKLGYSKSQAEDIIAYMLGRASLDGAPFIDPVALKGIGFTQDQIDLAEEFVRKSKSLDDHTPHVNPSSLKSRGLSDDQIKQAVIYIGGAMTVEGAPHLKPEHLEVFDCANRCGIGTRFIEPMGHIKMMAAVQPFLSGAISKTVNIPNESTVKDIESIYVEAWKLGLKAVALYRDGCKLSQPLTSGGEKKESKSASKESAVGSSLPKHKALPAKRTGIVHEGIIGGQKVIVRTGEFSDGSLGEVSIVMHKQGATMHALMDALSQAVTIGLQHGVPFEKFVDSLTFTRFEPAGMTGHPNVKTCTSVVDFVFRVLAMEYLGREDLAHVKPSVTRKSQIGGFSAGLTMPSAHSSNCGCAPQSNSTKAQRAVNPDAGTLSSHLDEMMGDAPACTECGHITVRSGSCYKCLNCGASMGCS
ncbi:MAG: vitamin B12-dependent ribonucleotide reductase [Nanoarchaeota archaeon]